MRLYLVQHGQATSEEENPDRPLTEQGVDEARRVARDAVERWGVAPARILHSEKTRAFQTAELWARHVGVGVEEVAGLAPNDDPTAWPPRLDAEQNDLMLVGHLPHLAKLATLLVTGVPDPPVVGFRPGALVALERDQSRWTIWLVLPPNADL